MRFRIIGAVAVHPGGPMEHLPGGLVERAGTVHQGDQFLDLWGVGRSHVPRQGNAVAVHEHVVLDAGFAPIRRVWATLLDTAKGAREATVYGGPRPVDPVGLVEAAQENLDELEPDTGGLPGVQSAPAAHAAAATHFLGQVFPGNTGLEDEENPG